MEVDTNGRWVNRAQCQSGQRRESESGGRAEGVRFVPVFIFSIRSSYIETMQCTINAPCSEFTWQQMR